MGLIIVKISLKKGSIYHYLWTLQGKMNKWKIIHLWGEQEWLEMSLNFWKLQKAVKLAVFEGEKCLGMGMGFSSDPG